MEGRIVWVFLIVAAKVGGSKDNLFPSLGQKLPSVGEGRVPYPKHDHSESKDPLITSDSLLKGLPASKTAAHVSVTVLSQKNEKLK